MTVICTHLAAVDKLRRVRSPNPPRTPPLTCRGAIARPMAPHLAPRAPKTAPRRRRAPPLTCEDVRPLGFEPRTCGLRVRCSAVELEAPRELPTGTYVQDRLRQDRDVTPSRGNTRRDTHDQARQSGQAERLELTDLLRRVNVGPGTSARTRPLGRAGRPRSDRGWVGLG